jgi:carboxypeptidase family protein
MLPSPRSRAALVAVVALVAGLLVAVAPAGSANAASTGQVVGEIRFPQKRAKVDVLWFTSEWQYLGRKKAGAGTYTINLAPGTYWLQFVDQRESYDIGKYAPTDVKVTVGSSRIIRNVRMQRGAYITGTARTGDGKPAAKATVTAANTGGRSFSTTANGKGQFAIGGLPQGKYSVFTWDKKKRWVGKSTWAGKVKTGHGTNVSVRLGKRAGALRLLLDTPTGPLKVKTSVTVTSKKTGQWWTATAKGGSAVFKGLYPGKYTLDFPGAGIWLRDTKPVKGATVRRGGTPIGQAKLTKRGGWITGQAVDAGAPAYPLEKAQVQLYDIYGTKMDETVTDSSGFFTLDGQLYTQTGMTVVINPNPQLGGYTQTTSYCQFVTKDLPGVPATQGRETPLGAVTVQRAPGQANPACAS